MIRIKTLPDLGSSYATAAVITGTRLIEPNELRNGETLTNLSDLFITITPLPTQQVSALLSNSILKQDSFGGGFKFLLEVVATPRVSPEGQRWVVRKLETVGRLSSISSMVTELTFLFVRNSCICFFFSSDNLLHSAWL
jgi:hypothetical protein